MALLNNCGQKDKKSAFGAGGFYFPWPPSNEPKNVT